MDQKINGNSSTGTPVRGDEILKAMMDDVFWLEQGKGWVKSGFENLASRSAKVQEAIAWFFGLSSAGTLIASFGVENLNKSVLAFMLIPLTLFLAAYGLQVFAQTIIFKRKTYYESPTLIEDTYFNVISDGKRLINWGAILTFLGFVITPVILFYAMAGQPRMNEPFIICEPILTKDSTITQLLISGRSGIALQSKITVALELPKRNEILFSTLHLSDSTGSINLFVQSPKIAKAPAGSKLITRLDVVIDSTFTKSILRKDPIPYWP